MELQEGSIGLDQWNEAQGERGAVTTEHLDQLVKDYRAAREEYDAAKTISNKLSHVKDDKEKILLDTLILAGKDKYHVDGIGLVYKIQKLVVPTPKTLEDKRKLFDYISEAHGEVFLMDKLSINHQTINKLYNDDFEEAAERGDTAFSIPGLQEPTHDISIGFRKEK